MTLFFISSYLTNVLFLITGWLAGYQMVRLERANPTKTIQLYTVLFCAGMVVAVARYNRVDPWLSLVFFLIAVSTLSYIIRQHRMVPPRKKFE